MKKLICMLCLFLNINVINTNQIDAACLHAIIVGDTVGGEEEIASSIDYMRREVKKIAALTDLKLNALSFEGHQVQIKNVIQHISDLDIKADDIVIFYCNSHGSRTHNKESCWPDLNFSIDIAFSGEKGGYLDFNYVNELVKSKNPRFFLSLAECCNTYRENIGHGDKGNNKENIFPIPRPACQQMTLNKNEINFIKNINEEETIKGYRHLFLNQKGSIIISSSIPGEPAIKYPVIGGIYTIQFLTTLHEAVSKWTYHPIFEGKVKNLTWEFVLEESTLMTKKELSLKDLNETPQYEIHLKGKNKSL